MEGFFYTAWNGGGVKEKVREAVRMKKKRGIDRTERRREKRRKRE